jgi:hypothetical protein
MPLRIKIGDQGAPSSQLMNSPTHERLLELNDRLLRPLITADTDEKRAQEVERILIDVAVPAARRVIGKFSLQEWRIGADESEDIISSISIRVLQKLRVVAMFEEEAIERFEDYVEILAQHSIYDYLRKRFPSRSRLRNRLRYLFARDPRFAMWSTASGMVIGLRAWHGSTDVLASLEGIHPSPLPGDPKHPAQAVETLLRHAGRPLRLETLVSRLCEIWNVDDVHHLAAVEPLEAPVVTRFETRQSLGILWEEIGDLPPLQRCALLLNLRESEGMDAITLFIGLGVATIEAIASAAGMTAEALAHIWSELPLDDLTIAGRLGITRQQVINLRKSARERLTRRLARRDNGKRKA